jgi:hypothetical protein
MGDLVAFLRARLDEDEAAAKAIVATFGQVGWMISENGEFDFTITAGALATEAIADAWNESAADWISRHDPARAFREVEAKRKILAERYGGPGHQDMWETVVRHLAAVCSDHPDYADAVGEHT